MDVALLWLLVAGIAVFPALLCWIGRFWTAGLFAIVWLGSAIWAWSNATDTRHLDYALAADGGDTGMIFAVGTVLYGLPIYSLGALIGLAFYHRSRIALRGSAGAEGTRK